MTPYTQKIDNGKIYRTFSPEVDDYEMKWHQDLKDRKVTILEAGGWSFQMDDGLPSKLSNAEQLWIPKLAWHRAIKGTGELKIEIEEFE